MKRLLLVGFVTLALVRPALADPPAPKAAVATPAPTKGTHPSAKSSHAPGAASSSKPATKGGYRSGGFRLQPRPTVIVTGVAMIWIFSPYAGQLVQVPESPTGSSADYPSCASASDCGDGELGHGAVCDRASFDLDSAGTGTCREACRDANDCPNGSSCVAGLDPDDTDWLGCIGQ